jgi:predicted nucleic acid-binding Zn ribbon protein
MGNWTTNLLGPDMFPRDESSPTPKLGKEEDSADLSEKDASQDPKENAVSAMCLSCRWCKQTSKRNVEKIASRGKQIRIRRRSSFQSHPIAFDRPVF